MKRWRARHGDFAARYRQAKGARAASGIVAIRWPTRYSPALAERICEEIMAGLAVRHICAVRGMPAPAQV